MSIGFRVCQRRSKVDASWIAKFQELPVANVSDVMSRVIGTNIPPMHNNGKVLAGAALTVRTRPGDNLMVHKALDMAEPGDVIVVDAGGEMTSAIVGELMVGHALAIGVAGLVIDGAIRDLSDIRRMGLPVHAHGTSHRGPYKDGPGEINVPVSVGGMVVQPGDLVLGDEDGLVAVPETDVPNVFELATQKRESEIRQMEQIRAGESDRSWVDRALEAGKCEIRGRG